MGSSRILKLEDLSMNSFQYGRPSLEVPGFTRDNINSEKDEGCVCDTIIP